MISVFKSDVERVRDELLDGYKAHAKVMLDYKIDKDEAIDLFVKKYDGMMQERQIQTLS